jgi:hypothetical protein
MKSVLKLLPSTIGCLSLFSGAVLLQHAGKLPSSAPAENSSLRSLSASALSFSPVPPRESLVAQAGSAQSHSYLGFDRNIYPGDDALPILRKTFSFASYWLSPPPEEKVNTWKGKRELLLSHGFGFLVLYRGRDSSELKAESDAMGRGIRDSSDAIASARGEGFAAGTTIFLDIEEGGRLSNAYHVYLRIWSEQLKRAGFLAGVYCSGIPVKEGPGVTITTAENIRNQGPLNEIVMWAFNDVCPPSLGCAFPRNPPAPSASGVSYATVWQFSQSPRRKERTALCPSKYAPDGNCYAPGDTSHSWFLDVNTSSSPDPSGGNK